MPRPPASDTPLSSVPESSACTLGADPGNYSKPFVTLGREARLVIPDLPLLKLRWP
jgi:hypothetical protein